MAPALALLVATAAFVPTLQVGDSVPAIRLVDQDGRAFSLQAFRGDALVVTFAYTRCPDAQMCPLATAKFARLQHILAGAPVHLVELTLDPAFDSPAVLRRYGRSFGADPKRWTLATGSVDSLSELAARFGITTSRSQSGALVHSESVAIVGRDGSVTRIVEGDSWSAPAVAALAREAAGDSAAPLASFGLWLTAAVQRCGGGTAALNALEALALFAVVAGGIGTLFLRSLRPSKRV